MNKSRRELSGLAGLAACALLAASPLLGCSKKERSVPPGPPGLPPASAGASASGGDRVHPPTSTAMPADHAQALRGRSEQPTDSPPPTPAIRGSLNLADNVKAKVPAGGTIFLIARGILPTGGPGPVLAAKRLTVGAWPQPFELSANDVMLAGMSLQGKVVLGARVDQDGDAMTKQAGDVEGISAPVEVPATGVVVLLDKLRTESAGAPSPPGMGGSLPAGHPTVAPTGAPTDSAHAPGAAPSLPPGHPPMGKPPGHP